MESFATMKTGHKVNRSASGQSPAPLVENSGNKIVINIRHDTKRLFVEYYFGSYHY